jgi:hypothetical protein
LDSSGSEKGVPPRIHGIPQVASTSSYQRTTEFGAGVSVGSGGGKLTSKRRCTGSPTSVHPRFLQPHFPGTKERFGKESFGYKSQASQSHVDGETLPHGNHQEYHPGPKTGRLDNISRSQGRIPPHSHSQGIVEVPEICPSRQGLRVCGPSLRASISPLCVYEGVVHTGTGTTQTISEHFPLPRRLVDEEHVSFPSSLSMSDAAVVDGSSRFYSKRGKVRFGTHSTLPIHRSVVRSGVGFGQTPFRALDKDQGVGRIASVMPEKLGQGVVQGLRTTHFGTGPCDPGQASCTEAPDTSEPSLGSATQAVCTNSHVQQLSGTTEVVADRKKCYGRHFNQSLLTVDSSVHRRLKYGVGGSSGDRNAFGSVVSSGETPPHQLPGTSGSDKSGGEHYHQDFGERDSPGYRQHDCRSVCKQSGGDPFSSSLPIDRRVATSSSCSRLSDEGSTHTRGSECVGRFSVEKAPGSGYGVEPASTDSVSDCVGLGSTGDGLVRHSAELQVPGVCITDSRSGGSRGGRHVARLERANSVRFPSNGSVTPSVTKDQSFRVQDTTDSAFVASKILVSGVARSPGGPPVGVASVDKVTETTQETDFPRSRGATSSSRLAFVRDSLEQKGFSKEVAKRVSEKNRASTNSLYQSRWRAFHDWCQERRVDSFQATVPMIADFLLSLFNKGMQPTTIRGYRTAISNTLSHNGRDLSKDADLSALLANLQRERPHPSKLMPTWDLSLVLRALTRFPFEPLDRAETKYLSFKTAFLIALASGCRVGEMHALDISTIRYSVGGDLIISTNMRFLSKTQRSVDTQKQLLTITIKSLSATLQRDMVEDRSLCPVRAVKFYLERTARHRRGLSRLFVSYIAMHQEVTKATISIWIKKLIRFAYTNYTKEDQAVLQFRAHDVRAFASSWAFSNSVSLTDVLQACSWKKHSTFSSFYLRDMSRQADDLHQLGPLAVAQHLI